MAIFRRFQGFCLFFFQRWRETSADIRICAFPSCSHSFEHHVATHSFGTDAQHDHAVEFLRIDQPSVDGSHDDRQDSDSGVQSRISAHVFDQQLGSVFQTFQACRSHPAFNARRFRPATEDIGGITGDTCRVHCHGMSLLRIPFHGISAHEVKWNGLGGEFGGDESVEDGQWRFLLGEILLPHHIGIAIRIQYGIQPGGRNILRNFIVLLFVLLLLLQIIIGRGTSSSGSFMGLPFLVRSYSPLNMGVPLLQR